MTFFFLFSFFFFFFLWNQEYYVPAAPRRVHSQMYFCFSLTQVLWMFPPPQEKAKTKATKVTGCLWPASGYSAIKATWRLHDRSTEHAQQLTRSCKPFQTCFWISQSDFSLNLGTVCICVFFCIWFWSIALFRPNLWDLWLLLISFFKIFLMLLSIFTPYRLILAADFLLCSTLFQVMSHFQDVSCCHFFVGSKNSFACFLGNA